MVLEEIGLLGISSPRTKAYVQKMVRRHLLPAFVILMSDERTGLLPGQTDADRPGSVGHEGRRPQESRPFDAQEPLRRTLESARVPYQVIDTTDVNDPRVVETVAARPEDIFIYSGAGGAILRRELLATGKKFLHVHPGLVPAYRGSTPLYYSILAEEACGASAIFLTERIDGGPVIKTKWYPLPEDGASIDYVYDPDIRSDLLLDVLEEYRRSGTLPLAEQAADEGETYYIIHPVLKHIAILACARARVAGRGGASHAPAAP